jgi:membrane-bound lytic murein transglycosylase D
VIAECAGVGVQEVQYLNAHLVGGTTPPKVRDYLIKLPVGTAELFAVKYAAVPESERILIVYHKIRRGETISSIARRYGVSSSALLSANDIPYSRRHKIRAGRTLVIPKGGYAKYAQAQARPVSRKKVVYHRIRKGDTLGGIARRYGVRVSQLTKWNKISRKTILRVGRKLKVYQRSSASASTLASTSSGSSTAKTHVVKRGETLWSISRKYGVSTDELAALNNLSSKSKIRAGQRLTLREASKQSVARKTASPSSSTTSYRLKRGETLGQVAQSHGVRVKDLMAWNNISNPRRVQAGKELIIKGSAVAAATPAAAPSNPVSPSVTKHKVKRGEALVTIARRYGVSVADLMAWNNIKNPRRIKAGQVLRVKGETPQVVPKPQPVEGNTTAPVENQELDYKNAENHKTPSSLNYKVKSGDTLWDIARRHRVTIAELQKWNDLTDPSLVKPGDYLAIHKK